MITTKSIENNDIDGNRGQVYISYKIEKTDHRVIKEDIISQFDGQFYKFYDVGLFDQNGELYTIKVKTKDYFTKNELEIVPKLTNE